MRKRILSGTLLATLVVLVIAVPVLAGYYAPLSVVEANGNSYTKLALQESVDIDLLVDNGYISATGLDTRVTSGGTPIPHMLAADRLMFVTDIVGYGTANLQFATGNTPLDSFPVIVGDGGYVTITDHANLEVGDDFEIEYDGYMDTSTASGTNYPDYVSTTESVHNTQVTDHTVTLPGTIVIGDLLILCFGWVPDAGVTVTWPNGWTEVFQDTSGTEGAGLAYRRADGTEGASVVVQTDTSVISAHHVLRIQNYQGTPEFAWATSEDLSPNPPSLTPSWGSKQTLWIAGFGGGNVGVDGLTVTAYPANYINTDNQRANEAATYNYAFAASCTRELTAVSEDPGVFTISGTTQWWAWTAAIQGDVDGGFVNKIGAFHIYSSGSNDIIAKLSGVTELTITATDFAAGEYIVNVWADETDFGIDIDGNTEDSTALGTISTLDNASNWKVLMPYFDYYTHNTSDTLRLTYEPDSIIVGTTLPNEENPGTYNGAITWGSNPAGFTVTLGGLISDFQPTPAGGQGQFTTPPDMVGETGQPGWTSDTDELIDNPFYSLVKAISDYSNAPISRIWVIGATFILVGAMLLGFRYIPHQLITMFIGMGLCLFFWHMGIYPFWVVFIFIAGGIAVIVSERTPSY